MFELIVRLFNDIINKDLENDLFVSLLALVQCKQCLCLYHL